MGTSTRESEKVLQGQLDAARREAAQLRQQFAADRELLVARERESSLQLEQQTRAHAALRREAESEIARVRQEEALARDRALAAAQQQHRAQLLEADETRTRIETQLIKLQQRHSVSARS